MQANLEKSQLMIVETKAQAFSLETRIVVIYTVNKQQTTCIKNNKEILISRKTEAFMQSFYK